MTQEEFREELKEDDRATEIHEYKLENDYDYFLEQHDELVFKLQLANIELNKLHLEWGHEYDLEKIIKG